jgi:hypothetical protein
VVTALLVAAIQLVVVMANPAQSAPKLEVPMSNRPPDM